MVQALFFQVVQFNRLFGFKNIFDGWTGLMVVISSSVRIHYCHGLSIQQTAGNESESQKLGYW